MADLETRIDQLERQIRRLHVRLAILAMIALVLAGGLGMVWRKTNVDRLQLGDVTLDSTGLTVRKGDHKVVVASTGISVAGAAGHRADLGFEGVTIDDAKTQALLKSSSLRIRNKDGATNRSATLELMDDSVRLSLYDTERSINLTARSDGSELQLTGETGAVTAKVSSLQGSLVEATYQKGNPKDPDAWHSTAGVYTDKRQASARVYRLDGSATGTDRSAQLSADPFHACSSVSSHGADVTKDAENRSTCTAK